VEHALDAMFAAGKASLGTFAQRSETRDSFNQYYKYVDGITSDTRKIRKL
jgi:hypothetical protein